MAKVKDRQPAVNGGMRMRRSVGWCVALIAPLLMLAPAVVAAKPKPHRAAPTVAAPPGTDYFTLTPCRVFDSRSAQDGAAPLTSGNPVSISAATLQSRCGVPAGTAAVSLNVTVVSPSGLGMLFAYAAGTTPALPVVNFNAGAVRANNAVVALSAGGDMSVQPYIPPSGTVHVIVDVNGYFDLPPAVTTTSPTDGATAVNVTSAITINFSEPVNVTGTAFTVECPTGTPQAFTVSPASPAASFTLTPTSSLPQSTTCTVTAVAAQISDVDAGQNLPADYVFTFTTAGPPTVVSTTPANGASGVAVSATVTVDFSESVNATGTAFGLECPSGTPVAFGVSPASPASSFTLTPSASLPVGTACQVKVTAAQVTGTVSGLHPTADYTGSFTTDSPPSVTTTLPANGATGVNPTATITVDFSESVNVTGTAFKLECPSGTPTAFTVTPASPATSFVLHPSASLPLGVLCTVTVVATEVHDVDTGLQLPADDIFSFTVDVAPTVASTVPTNGATGVAPSSTVTINFSEPVNVTGTAFTLECPSGTPISFTVTPASPAASFVLHPVSPLPTSALAPAGLRRIGAAASTRPVAGRTAVGGTTCAVTVHASEVTDVDSGLHLAADYPFSFTTDAPPAVTSTTPTNGATAVATNAAITIDFSESVNVTGTAFKLECPSGTPQAFSVSPASPAASFTLTPSSALPAGVVCTATVVAAQVTDVDAGQNLPADTVFSFTVNTLPTVTSTVPTNGAIGVDPATTITINFSESVNASTSSFTIECPTGTPIAFTLAPASPASSFVLTPTAPLPASALAGGFLVRTAPSSTRPVPRLLPAAGTVCTVTVVAAQVTDADAGEHLAADDVFSFTLDSPPAVTGTTPTNGATVLPDATVTFTFSESVNVNGSSFKLECPSGTPAAFTVSPASPAAAFTLTPSSPLPGGVTCTATAVAAQITDTDVGQHMSGDYAFGFTVDAPPSVTTTVPTNGATGVPGTSAITINFSESVNATASSFTINCGSAQAFSLSASPATSFTLTPSATLPGNASCTVTALAAQITDVDFGQHPTGDASFSFTVANNPPVPGADTYDTVGNTLLQVAGSDTASGAHVYVNGNVLTNDSDADGPSPIVITGIVGCADLTAPFDCATVDLGTVSLNADGSFVFTPKAGDTNASDSFQYTISDGATTANGLVTINLKQRVWYVKNDATAGGLGRSSDPFDTLGEAQTASLAGDYIFVYYGDGSSTGQNAGIVLKDGQHLIGEHHGLAIPITAGSFNGVAAPTSVPLVTAVPGNRPLIDDTNGPAVTASSSTTAGIPAEIVGLSLGNTGTAADVVSFAPSPSTNGTGTLAIQDNLFRQATRDAIRLYPLGNLGSTQTFTVTGNTWDAAGTFVGDGIVLLPQSSNTTVVINASGNTNILTTGGPATAGMRLDWAYGSPVRYTITGLADNTVSGNSTGTGITSQSAVFDATPGGTFQTVSGGNTVIGASGNGVGSSGIVLNGVQGDLNFTGLEIYTSNGWGLYVHGTGAFNNGGGTGAGMSVSAGLGVGTIDATGGPAVDLATTSANLQLASLKSTNSAATGVSLVSMTDYISPPSPAIFTAGLGSSITNATGTDFNIDGGTATVSYVGTITDTTGRLVSITNTTGDTKTFTGAISDSGSGTGQGIFLNGNTGATISFTGKLTLSTGSNDAFTATGGGTVTATDTTSTLATTTGTALNVANTTIGASGLKFQSISAGTAASGPANGIVLNNTGSSGGLSVLGTGSAGSGGTIRKGATGISLTSASKVSLNWMQLNDFSDYAIRGTSVSAFTMASCVVNGVNGNAAGEGGVYFTNLTGTSSITGSDISGGVADNVNVTTSSGTLDLTVSGSNIHNTQATAMSNDNLFIQADTTATVTAHVTNNTFAATAGDHTQVNTLNGASMTIVFTGNNWSGGFAGGLLEGLTISGGNAGSTETVNFNVSNNGSVATPLTGTVQGGAINVNQGSGGGTWKGRVENNVIGNPAVANSGASQSSGIRVENHSVSGTMVALVNGNTVRQWNGGPAINFQVGDTGNVNSAFDVTVTNNTVSNPGSLSQHGVVGNFGADPSGTNAVCADWKSNNVDLTATPPNSGSTLRLRQRNSSTVKLPGYGGAATDTTAVSTFESGQNTLNPTGDVTAAASGLGGGFVGGAACLQPPAGPI